MIDSTTSGLTKFTFTSWRGVVKNPQFWAQFFHASISAFKRYLLKKEVLRCWVTFETGESSKPQKVHWVNFTFFDA